MTFPEPSLGPRDRASRALPPRRPTRIESAWRALLPCFSSALLALAPAISVHAQAAEPPGAPPAVPSLLPGESRLAAGERLAKIYCGSCHMFPRPDLLDKKTWREQTLLRMKIRMGLSPRSVEMNPESELLKATGVIPTVPMVSEEDYALMSDYYIASAPERPLPQEPRPEIRQGLALFKPDRPKYRRPAPMTTMVRISQDKQRIYVGDAEGGTLDILGADGSPIESLRVGNVPVSLNETPRGLYLTMIGSFLPSERTLGELILMERAEKGFKPGRMLLQTLPRVTHTELADLNGDGKSDLVVCHFGNTVGRLSWYENQGGDKYREHVLIPKPGALRAEVRDLDGNGTLDLAVLVAQDTETMFFMLNDGKGSFTPRPILQKHPLFGHSHFELADFNKDGQIDLLVSNGDNGEYASPLKNYHGIRIYLNRGKNQFEEASFFPLNGAYGALARDFDEDGDLDIAAISFFPDYENSPGESFVYLENTGKLEFRASTFRECITGRWLVLDAGDLDGDGDLDLVLGSYIRGPTEVPAVFSELWEKIGPSVLILKNLLRQPAPPVK